jgi:hypothetical protein
MRGDIDVAAPHRRAPLRATAAVADAKTELDRLPVMSSDQNVVAAGVNAIAPVRMGRPGRGRVMGFVVQRGPLRVLAPWGSRSWRLRDGAGHEDVPLREGLAAAVAEKRPCALSVP